MQYPRILAAVYGAYWSITPMALSAIRTTLASRLRGEFATLSAQTPQNDPEDDPEDPDNEEDLLLAQTGIQVISVHGIIGKYLGFFDTACGGFDLNSLEQSLQEARANPQVKAIVLHFNSPGGTITGVPEMGTLIKEIDAEKPVYGFTDTLCCSAAYWMASQCRQMAITPSAEIGSIGVYSAIVDESKSWEKDGLKLELMKAGDHKAAGIAGLPLSDGDREMIQGTVNDFYGSFTSAITANRPGVSTATMQGQTFIGQKAVDAALADGVVSSFSQFIGQMQSFINN